MTLLGNPTRKRVLRRILLAYASGYPVFKQHQCGPAALENKTQENKQPGL